MRSICDLMIEKLKNNPCPVYFAGILLLIPALLINLGKLNIFMAVDEATRGLVALEMMIRDQFITPTINGEFYYNKPPLFNWIVAAFFSVFGINEFVLRLPTALSLIGFGFTVYYFVKQELGRNAGIITAFMFVTTGRLLFWESLLGYIDTTFSWAVYTGMMFTHFYFRRRQYLKLFLVSYFFMAIGFMLKGLPAIVFQGFTLLVLFISEREFKKLFTWKHLVGGLAFLVPVGTFYLIYNQYNSLENVFNTLWHESTERTVVDQGWLLTVKHLYLFPTEMLYHYLPWTLLLVFAFRKGFWSMVFENKFIKFNLLVVLVNIIPYWTSPDVYPKYIMALIPMALTVFIYFYLENSKNRGKLADIFEMVLIGVATLLTLAYLAIPFIPAFQVGSLVILKAAGLFIVSALFVFLMMKIKEQRIVLFAIVLIIGRIGFDWFVWPQRAPEWVKYEDAANKVAEITGNEKVYYYQAPMLQYGGSYYMSLAKWQIIGKEKGQPETGVFYIVDDDGLEALRKQFTEVKVFYDWPNVEDGRRLSLIKIVLP